MIADAKGEAAVLDALRALGDRGATVAELREVVADVEPLRALIDSGRVEDSMETRPGPGDRPWPVWRVASWG